MPQKAYRVEAEHTLLPFLTETMKDKSRTTLKSYLAHRQIEVNGVIVKQFDTPLRPGDTVTLCLERRAEELNHPMLRLVYEDQAVIVVEKHQGLLSIGTDRDREKTAHYILSAHVKRSDPQNRIFIVHRLDRATSGLMIFAKSEAVKMKMQSSWDETMRERKYVAVVEGTFARPEGVISAYLSENKRYKMFVSNKNEGERAVTSYRVLQASADYSLLELELQTGKKNQIRAHLEYVGHPIVGDEKYGAKTDPLQRVALHAYKLCFIHPVTGQQMDFSTPIPSKFMAITRS